MKINDITNNDAVTLIQATVNLGAEDKQKTQIIQICERGDQERDKDVDTIKMMTTYMLYAHREQPNYL